MPESLLSGVRVLDAATLAAAPLAATYLAEHGAEVIKVERPGSGDPIRDWGRRKDGTGLMWKSVGRNKKSVTLNLRTAEGQDLLRQLAGQADVLVVNTRPGTLRGWGLDYATMHAAYPKLIMVHVTGFGLDGPDSDRPGFGTLGEAMSGFAHLTGEADSPPTLPSFMLADSVTSLTAAYAVMMALYHRDVHDAPGQLIDLNLIDPLSRMLEPSVLTYDQLGEVPRRCGNRWDVSAPRNTYLTKDRQWIAMSGSAPTVALRVYRAIGRPELADDPEFSDPQRRLARSGEVDAMVAEWVSRHTRAEAMTVFRREGVAAAPVYDAPQLLEDPHLKARGIHVRVPDEDLGSMRVQGPVPRFSATPGRVEHLGPALGEHNKEIYGELLGIPSDQLAALADQGVI
ncbi:CoA transferase [Amycolatopsis rubida]|uniref:CoA transferase n=1 Tax=Amycolatopsis rubida TaxID=112413 RepID=A0ABX0BQI8_9PSEU|nr:MULTISPECIES: CoA transferase [Amycolatopsis]MYW91691.1 CoA transferase [Amycolatopsis rubida]NEC56675.1 CoA transferase [Amycolatopsis rubida]OAP20434.1 Succinyl-CoA:(R)-benzylsuccinate CoA-transferase subunit BbsF [Amycolatopsis sp. M39]